MALLVLYRVLDCSQLKIAVIMNNVNVIRCISALVPFRCAEQALLNKVIEVSSSVLFDYSNLLAQSHLLSILDSYSNIEDGCSRV
jgi:hypothetical protein